MKENIDSLNTQASPAFVTNQNAKAVIEAIGRGGLTGIESAVECFRAQEEEEKARRDAGGMRLNDPFLVACAAYMAFIKMGQKAAGEKFCRIIEIENVIRHVDSGNYIDAPAVDLEDLGHSPTK